MKQIFNELKSQPVIATVTIAGTALAIFLIMIVVMMQQVKTESFGQEPNRDRMLYLENLQVKGTGENGWAMASRLSSHAISQIFDNLEGVELYTTYGGIATVPVGVKGTPQLRTSLRQTDPTYWRVFAHNFIAGHPYDSVMCANGDKNVVITRGIARRYWTSPEQAVGKELCVNRTPYTVIGVVGDVSPLATEAFAQIWTPYKPDKPDDGPNGFTGGYCAAALVDRSSTNSQVKDATDRRVAEINTRLSSAEFEINTLYHPFDQEQMAIDTEWGSEPDVKGERKRRYILYLILLIIPAVNLAGMTQSRLRHRKAEIGVRRAFGAPRGRIIRSILTENLVITLIGGILGLAFSLAFAYLFAPLVFADSKSMFQSMETAPIADISAMFHWSTFILALIFCFILNFLSAGIPAIHASRINTVNAINGNER